MHHKAIKYDRETRDYAGYLDGELVGFFRTYHDAEVALDNHAYDLLRYGLLGDADLQMSDDELAEVA